MTTHTFLARLAAADGEAGAWNDLVARHRPGLVALVRPAVGRGLRSKLDAEDLVQDALLAAYESRGQFAGTTPAELDAWLRRIVASRLSHAVRQFYGSRARDVRLELPAPLASGPAAGIDLPDSGTSPSRGAMRREDGDRVEAALRRLPADYQAVVVWRERQGLSFAEIAALLGRSENAVRKLWPRAVAALQHLLTPGK